MDQTPEGQKGWVAGVFDRAASTYDLVGDSYHAELGRRLVETAVVLPGDRVLDVACGRGAVLIPAAKACGPGGLAIGTDISAEMVRLANEDCAGARLTNCRTLVMDAEAVGFQDNAFSFVFCAFGVFFLPDPTRAAREFARVLRPGGVVALSSWGEDDPRWEWEDEIFGRVSVRRRAVSQPFSTPDSLSDLLESAGLRDVYTRGETLDIRFTDEAQWWAWKWSFSLRGMLEQLGEEELADVRASAFERMRPLRTGEGYEMRLNATFALGRRP